MIQWKFRYYMILLCGVFIIFSSFSSLIAQSNSDISVNNADNERYAESTLDPSIRPILADYKAAIVTNYTSYILQITLLRPPESMSQQINPVPIILGANHIRNVKVRHMESEPNLSQTATPRITDTLVIQNPSTATQPAPTVTDTPKPKDTEMIQTTTNTPIAQITPNEIPTTSAVDRKSDTETSSTSIIQISIIAAFSVICAIIVNITSSWIYENINKTAINKMTIFGITIIAFLLSAMILWIQYNPIEDFIKYITDMLISLFQTIGNQ